MWKIFSSTVVVVIATLSLAYAADPVRERILFDSDWRFQKDDPAGAAEQLSYEKLRPWLLPTGSALVNFAAARSTRPEGNVGASVSYAQPAFDDASWRSLSLPHDWGIEGPFKQELSGETGKLPWAGVGWYRKHFSLPGGDKDRRVYLDIDGAMAQSAVWLNGQFVGGWPYGYTSFRLDLTPYAKLGEDNVIAIRLDNLSESSRWYPGGGIYRHVWLVKTEPVHVAQWGTFVTTPRISADTAVVTVDFTLENNTTTAAKVKVTQRIYELGTEGHRSEQPVASSDAVSVLIPAGKSSLSAQTLQVAKPKLWSLKKPNRYVVETAVEQDGKILDNYQTPFGIRTAIFDVNKGFLLNGEVVRVNGVCDHHDLGALGTAINTRALERQIEILQEMGCNAIRTSHNPPAPELLELCDRMGMLVMDESFDCWHSGKKRLDYQRFFDDWHEKDLRALVRRDRNHPSVIMWSIGNEVREQTEPEGWKLATHLAGIVREEDRTRATVSAFNHTESGYNGFQTAVDVVGFNYKPAEYGIFRQRNPDIPVIGSETSSCVSSRGEYFFPVSENKADGRADFQVSSYDLYAPRWAFPPDAEFKGLDTFPFTAGEFVWTGFDYLGEPTPYNADTTNLLNFSSPADQERVKKELQDLGKIQVPSRSSYFGIIDLAGFRKDRFYIYQARWRPDLPMAHILPHWTWPDRVGQVTPIHVYTSGDEAELFLNGKSLGRKKREALQYRLRWDDVKYEPGEVRVVAYKKGKKWAEDTVKTAGAAAQLKLRADHAKIKADGNDLTFITVSVTDSKGVMAPRAKNQVKFELSGPGEIAGVDNGDATSFEPFQASERKAYNGLCLVIVRTKPNQVGVIKLTARADGLTEATTEITATDSQ